MELVSFQTSVAMLASGSYPGASDPAALLGDSGTARSHLLYGLGMVACEHGSAVRDVTCGGLVNELAESAEDRTRGNRNCALFIIDPHNPFRTLEIRAEAELTADPEKTTVRKFAKIYSIDESMLVDPTEDRYTVTYRPRRLVANPPAHT
jgi:hypothetical protein